MSWEVLCGGRTIVGTKVTPGTLSADHAKRQPAAAAAIPAPPVITAMITEARKLKLKNAPKPRSKGAKGKKEEGIAFHVVECNVGAGGALAMTPRLNVYAGHKSGSSVCYENSVLPVAGMGTGHILVHQSVAPCTRCRAGYSAWARARRCTIVVETDLGYDRSGDNATFLFLPTGLVLYDS